MKILVVSFVLFLSIGMTLAQDTSKVDTYKIAFFSKDATGVFQEMQGNIVTKDKGVPVVFDLTIDVSSINTSNGVQNKHAKSSDWFHAEKYPNIIFKSSEVFTNEEGVFAKGNLLLHGVSKEITIPIEVSENDTKFVYKAKFNVDRKEYELGPDSKVSPSIKIIAAVTIKK